MKYCDKLILKLVLSIGLGCFNIATSSYRFTTEKNKPTCIPYNFASLSAYNRRRLFSHPAGVAFIVDFLKPGVSPGIHYRLNDTHGCILIV